MQPDVLKLYVLQLVVVESQNVYLNLICILYYFAGTLIICYLVFPAGNSEDWRRLPLFLHPPELSAQEVNLLGIA